MLTIGELSRVTRLSVKALRLYHEKGILIPGKVDLHSRYRYYRRSDIEKALMIAALKEMGFSLDEIGKILLECGDDEQMAEFVRKKMAEVDNRMKALAAARRSLASFLENLSATPAPPPPDIVLEETPPTIIAAIRFTGAYPEVGEKFRILFKTCGRHIAGKPFSLYYDEDYRENNADIEACLPIKQKITAPDVQCRELPAISGVSVFHRGAYSGLGATYARLFSFCREKGLEVCFPLREHYIKGPGIIFRGNPAKYITNVFIRTLPLS